MKEVVVSVVVPVYNVQDYLKECVDSLLQQTYDKYEILLIDDGSTDESGTICDAYQAKNAEIIKVFHRSNSGLAATRNFGASQASGRFIAFIDSDDYVSPELLSLCVNSLMKSNSDMVMFNFKPFGELSHAARGLNNFFPSGQCVSGEVALELLLRGRIRPYACMSIYKIELVRANRFPSGRNYEDVSTTYKLLDQSRSVSFVDEKLYFYRQRGKSISHRFRSKDATDILKFDDEMEKYMEEKNISIREYSYIFRLNRLLTVTKIAAITHNKNIYREAVERISNVVTFQNLKLFNRQQKIKVFLIKIKLWKKIITSKVRLQELFQ